MKISSKKPRFPVSPQLVIGAAFALSCSTWVTAGTQGAYMNSAGYGKAADSIVYAGVTNKAISVAMYSPCAAVNPQNFTCNATYTKTLPPGTPATVYCQSKGAPGYIWSIRSYVTGGASADNPDLENRLTIAPTECASYTLDSQATFTDAYSGAITVNASATAGAAVWVRGYEFHGSGVPADLEDLQANGTLKFDVAVAGPFDFNSGNCTALTIPFTTETGHENLYVVADGLAKSIPFELVCPEDVVFGCGDTVVYPGVMASGGCGNVTLTYAPPANALPFGVTPVTVTATDEAGNSAQCTFTATRNTLTFNGFASPIGGTGGSAYAPLRTFVRGCVIPVKFKTLCDCLPYTSGTPTLTIRRCPSTPVGGGNFQMVAHQWHFNWNTRGLAAGTYELIATLQDGSRQRVFIKLR